MPNETGAGRAICPYYRNEDSRSLRCDGFLPGTVMRMCFTGEKRKDRWQEEVCSRFGYDQACPLAAALTAHYEQTQP